MDLLIFSVMLIPFLINCFLSFYGSDYKIRQQKDGWWRVYGKTRFFGVFFFWEKTFGCYKTFEQCEEYMARCMEYDRRQAGQRSNP